ncbi:LysM repeat protein [Anaerosolibacter carboniphilus]|uniref:LysM repeat protein n=1 Tax=Anaerosolibacter carboniphilus TaxID=1417629 RepID=A0A841KUB0_9FIRM|nr:LysM peptidoglycan-binding domain-containing protein [Anaerosolibacter carboniphilus]MBB6215768.1 LysM repeat protein [Anaerosolibacter carboniphilus]
MINLKKLILSSTIGLSIFAGSMGMTYGQDTIYKVQAGDTFWIISQKYGITIESLMRANDATEKTVLYAGQSIIIPTATADKLHTVQSGDTFWIISQKYGVDINLLMKTNNATQSTVLNVGDKIIIPTNTTTTNNTTTRTAVQVKTYTVQAGDTYWIISQKLGVDIRKLMDFNGHTEKTVLYTGQQIKIPPVETTDTTQTSSSAPTQNTELKPYITYTSYTVQKGDDFWKISLKFGISMYELMKVNNMSEATVLNIGDQLKIPVHHVPVKPTPGSQYGEYLDWWTEAQYVVPIGAQYKMTDFYTGKSWNMKRTMGANHADCEPVTKADAEVMKSVWDGAYSWKTRPVIVEYNGRKIAASAASMPHDVQTITDNEFGGHMDVHFANSTRHKDGEIDWDHQANIKIAAGIK